MSILAKIVGVGRYLPEKVVSNQMLEQMVETTDKWIKKRTGIQERRVATTDNTTSMAIKAAKAALANANTDPGEIGIILGTTVTADRATPSMASLVQRGIGCEKTIAMDLSAGCTGFVYALTTLIGLMETCNVDTALIVSSEYLTSRVDWSDRGTCILFGDGAGAVVVKRSDKAYITQPVLTAIPDTNDVLYIKNKSMKNPWSEMEAVDDITLKSDGREVFAFAVDAIEKVLADLTSRCGKENIHKIIPHQANSRIISYAARVSGFDKDQFYVNIDRFANTSSATIPIALSEANETGWIKKGDKIALIGFGAGLTYGGIMVEWDI